MKKLNILIIGAGMYVCGRGTKNYGTILPSVLQINKEYNIIENISICCTSKKSLNLLKNKKKKIDRKFNFNSKIEYFTKNKNNSSYLEAISKSKYKYDCAIIAVPDHLHFKIIKDILNQNINVLVVKPLVNQISEALKLVKLAENKNLFCMVEFHKRFDESNIKLKEFFKDRKVGLPLYFHVEYSQRRDIPLSIFKKWSNYSNIFQYLGVHYVDLIYFITGAIPLRLMAIGQKKILTKKNINTYDSIQVIVEWRLSNDKFVSTFLTNWIDPNKSSAMSDQKIKLIGTAGRIELDQKNRGIQIVTDKEGIEDINPYFSDFFYELENDADFSFKGYGYKSIYNYLSKLHLVLNNKILKKKVSKNSPTFRSSLISVAVLEAVNKSLNKKNQWIKIDSKSFIKELKE